MGRRPVGLTVALCDGRCGTGRLEHVLRFGAFRIGIACLFSVQHPDSHAEVVVETSGGDFSIFQQEVAVGGVFKIKVGIGAAITQRCPDKVFNLRDSHFKYVQIML